MQEVPSLKIRKPPLSSNSKNYNQKQPPRFPTHEAIHDGIFVRAIYLLSFHSLEEQDENGNTPLHIAAKNGHINILQFLLRRRASLHSRNENLQTPLHYAAKFGHEEILRTLILAGSDINAKDIHGDTPLHESFYFDHQKCTETLLCFGANLDATNIHGRQPLSHIDPDDSFIHENYTP